MKKVYVVRSVDLLVVAFNDEVFNTLKEAKEEIRSRIISDDTIDMIIRVSLENAIYLGLLDDEIDTYDTINQCAKELEILYIRKGA